MNELYEEFSAKALEMLVGMEGLKAGSEELENQSKIAKSMFDSCVNYHKESQMYELEKVKTDKEIHLQEEQMRKELYAKYIELGVTSALAIGQIAIGVWAFSFANVFEMEDTYAKQTSKQIVTKMIDLMKLRK